VIVCVFAFYVIDSVVHTRIYVRFYQPATINDFREAWPLVRSIIHFSVTSFCLFCTRYAKKIHL